MTCAGVGACYAVAVAFTVSLASRLHGTLRFRWSLLAVAFSLRTSGFIAIFYGEYILRFTPTQAWISELVFLLRALPTLLALTTSDDEAEPTAFAWLDGAQLLLVGATLSLNLFPGLGSGRQTIVPAVYEMVSPGYKDAVACFLLILAAARFITAVNARARSFYGVVLGLTLVASLIDYFLNHYAIQKWSVPPGSIFFVLADLPVLVLFVLVWQPMASADLKPPKPKWGLALAILRLCSPAFFALAVLLLSIQMTRAHFALGVVTSCLGLGIYAVRSGLLQLRDLHIQNELAESNDVLSEISRKDALTGVFNRRWFDAAQRAEWIVAQRTGQPLALLLVDIDHFKRFNDAFGHKAGDECLVMVARTLSKQLRRRGDSVARYGGEEFTVLMPNTDSEGALEIAERMRRAVKEESSSTDATTRRAVTISVGVASVVARTNGASPDTLFMQADAALYHAKQGGRNRVEVA